MLVLAGQGNPGARYAGNRHNIGFMAVDEIARRWRFGPERSRFSSLVREGEIETPAGAVRTLILKPQTFYNESGRAVSEALKFYKLKPADLVLFYDEIDLAPGRFRMKLGGGAAGNNGVRSVTAHVGPDFRRARLGVESREDDELSIVPPRLRRPGAVVLEIDDEDPAFDVLDTFDQYQESDPGHRDDRPVRREPLRRAVG